MKDTLLQRLQCQPSALDSLLFGLTEEEVKSHPIPDKWSVFENLAHLARYHEVFKERAELITSGTNPVFQRYKADDDSRFFEWQKRPYKQLMNDFHTGRTALNAYMASFSEDQLKNTSRHPFFGLMNMEGWTEFFLLHEAHHFFTLVRLTALLQPDRVMGLY